MFCKSEACICLYLQFIKIKGATSSKKDNEASHLLVQDEFEGDLLSTFSKLSLQHQCICQPDKPTIVSILLLLKIAITAVYFCHV